MSLFHSPRIVTDGLVLCLDAGNIKSYPGSGTTWTDLSGRGNTGTLTNGPTYSSANGGSIVFDGTNDYVTSPGGSDFAFGSGDFTIELWVYLNTVVGGPYFVYDARPESTQGAYPCLYMSGTTLVYQVSSTDILNATVTNNSWFHIVTCRIGTTIRMYINGVQQSSATDSTTYLNGGSGRPGIGGGGYSTSTYFLNARISNLRVLKGKGLTAQEVSQNFNALRARFGI